MRSAESGLRLGQLRETLFGELPAWRGGGCRNGLQPVPPGRIVLLHVSVDGSQIVERIDILWILLQEFLRRGKCFSDVSHIPLSATRVDSRLLGSSGFVLFRSLYTSWFLPLAPANNLYDG
jgi:hypothetical protein